MSYYSSKQHIAASGAKAGQWVKCIAQGNCRLSGLHVEERTLKEVQDWAGRRAYADLTQKDYEFNSERLRRLPSISNSWNFRAR